MGILLKEIPGCNYVKVALRSRDIVDVSRVATAFGGGGHLHAAGCEIPHPIGVAAGLVVDKVVAQLQGAAAT